MLLDKRQARTIYRQGEEPTVHMLCGQSEEIEYSHQTIQTLEDKVKKLEDQLAKNSSNSNKPPSSDGFKKPKPKSLRNKTGRKPGGQEGHEGHTLNMVKTPDKEIIYTAGKCKRCHHSLEDQKPFKTEKRQVFDLPPIDKMHVTQHEVQLKRCPDCHALNAMDFPKDILAPVQYGPRLRSMITYLKTYQLIPFKRTAELLKDLFGVSLSEGTLANTTQDCSKKVEKPLDKISKNLIESPIVHFDETGCHVKKDLKWLHVASNTKHTLYNVHVRRGKVGMDDMGILPEFKGRAIHDGLQSYFQYEDSDHGLCNSHHLRELIFVHEQVGQDWAKDMKDLLLDIKEDVANRRSSNKKSLAKDSEEKFENGFQLLLDIGYSNNPLINAIDKRGHPYKKKTKIRNLVERLDKYRDQALAFMYDFEVPFDNNLAERDIRMMRVQQKISGTFRSNAGARDFSRIRSYISTAGKNAIDAMDAVQRVFAGKPFTPRSGALPT